jgi:hypothetical protein
MDAHSVMGAPHREGGVEQGQKLVRAGAQNRARFFAIDEISGQYLVC